MFLNVSFNTSTASSFMVVNLVKMKSLLRSLINIPQAEKTEEFTGIITLGIFNSLAKETACIPPPPPNATKVKSLGSYPLLTETNFKALIILLLAILIMPLDVSSMDKFKFLASTSRYLFTEFISAFISPPQK